MTIDHNCYECGAPLALKRHVEIVRVGAYTVEDGSQMLAVCANGHAEVDGATFRDYQRRAILTLLADVPELGGGEWRIVRRHLDLTQADFAGLLDVTAPTVSRWENGHEAPSRAHRLAMMLFVAEPHRMEEIRSPRRVEGKRLTVRAVAA